jgi:hypothetical protein
LIELYSIPASQGRIAGYRIGEDQSGGNGTILQPSRRFEISPMSALGQKRTQHHHLGDVGFAPQSRHAGACLDTSVQTP